MEPIKTNRNLRTVGDLEHFAMLIRARLKSGIDTASRAEEADRMADLEIELENFNEQIRLIFEEVEEKQEALGAEYNANTELTNDPLVLANYLHEQYSPGG